MTAIAAMQPIGDADVEREIIAAVLVEPAVLAELGEICDEHLTDYRHVAVWSAIRRLEGRGAAITVESIEYEIERLDHERGTAHLDAVGGPAYLGQLVLDSSWR